MTPILMSAMVHGLRNDVQIQNAIFVQSVQRCISRISGSILIGRSLFVNSIKVGGAAIGRRELGEIKPIGWEIKPIWFPGLLIL